MNLKMSPNSLFAVLLRSPWWISMVLVALFVVASYAWLPEVYRPLGAMGGIPFFCIGCVALWRQLRAPGAKRSEAILQSVAGMSWPEFCKVLERAFERDGFSVERLQGAADLLLRRDGRTMLVSAKRWKAARHGEDALQALHEQARSLDASGCRYVALGELSPNAQRLATRHRIEVVQASSLVLLLRDLSLPPARK